VSTERTADDPVSTIATPLAPIQRVDAAVRSSGATSPRIALDPPRPALPARLDGPADVARALGVAAEVARTLGAAADVALALSRTLTLTCDALGFESAELWRRDGPAAPLRLTASVGAPVIAADTTRVTCHVPIVLHGDVDGEVIYQRSGPEPDAMTLCLLELVATQVAQFLDHRRAADEREQWLARERALREEAEAANRAKDEFLANVSHELRTPLNAILGWSRLLHGGLLDAETIERGLAAVQRNAEAQEHLISDLLDIARIVTGKLQLQLEPVQLASIVQAAVDAIRHEATGKRLTLDVRLADPPTTPADGDRLQQVVWNLLSNAIRCTPEGGRIAVTLEAEPGRAVIRVSDDGIGIAPEVLPHIFERFRQGQGGTTRRQRGLGLGLSIVRHLTELHGGTVRAESAGPGRGATFIIELPLIQAPAIAPTDVAAPAAPARCLAQRRVLLVDDDADARDLLGMVLQKHGAEVSGAASADEAVVVFRREGPDAVVSDIGLPDADGYELIRRLRALDVPAAHSAVAVAFTGWARAEDRDAAIEAGFQAHVVKPVDPDELVALLARLVAERRPAPVVGTGIARL
jgi:signal transduction histidine kinase/ActR/RegA family two-component response regulator